MSIIIKTQIEWDALPAEFSNYTVIEIRSGADIWLIVKSVPTNARVEARESAHVVAWESRTSRRGNRRTSRRGSRARRGVGFAYVEAWGSAHVEARERARRGVGVATSRRGSRARRGAGVGARRGAGVAYVVARESAHVVARESAHVEAWEAAHVVARESSHVEAWDSAYVEAWGSAHVEARESAHVEARGCSTVHQKSAAIHELYGQSVCFLYDGYAVPLRKSDGVTFVKVAPIKDNAGWLEANAVVEADGHVILYKRVSKDLMTQENTSNPTTSWAIGKVKEHQNWKPHDSECGPGKYHACSKPYFCDEFRKTPGDRYIALKIALTDIHAWPGGDYPHKIAFRKGVVLYECDRYGKEIQG